MLKKTTELGTFYGVRVYAHPSVIPASVGLAVVSALIAGALGAGIILAILGAVVAVLLHWVNAMVHQIGHSTAARLTGYPMHHATMYMILETSVYPRDEPELPAAVHRRRALGGPLANLLWALVWMIPSLVLFFGVGAAAWPLYFMVLESVFVFCLAAFVPLHMIGLETDGSTLLKHWRG
ncbi:MAG: hypothetical protein ACLFTK_01080 [Anaerolineales bacterium]